MTAGEVLGAPMRIRRFRFQNADLAVVSGDAAAALFTLRKGESMIVLGLITDEVFNDGSAGTVTCLVAGNVVAVGAGLVATADTVIYAGMNGVTLAGDGTAGRATLVVATTQAP